jgi:hypothetical protein
MPKPVRAMLVALVMSVVASLGNAASVDAASVGGAGLWTQTTESDTPPGNPVVGTEPRGDGSQDRTSYVLLSVLAGCLIGAGVLLVKVERWQKTRSSSG